MNILVFDIETVPDVESGAKLLDLNNLSKEDTIKAMEHTQFQKTGNMFQPLHLQPIDLKRGFRCPGCAQR